MSTPKTNTFKVTTMEVRREKRCSKKMMRGIKQKMGACSIKHGNLKNEEEQAIKRKMEDQAMKPAGK